MLHPCEPTGVLPMNAIAAGLSPKNAELCTASGTSFLKAQAQLDAEAAVSQIWLHLDTNLEAEHSHVDVETAVTQMCPPSRVSEVWKELPTHRALSPLRWLPVVLAEFWTEP
ncbi:hypothetical protein KIL84_005216 [Mauremys mutica]|uniref:Uncharacterized protein n=1 Tax=Mauremys mutica TaxID=74926 RepID=A0A9D3XLW9_9SAUR|nr:hypothetical protein KIL84_005216 [Mauremys mutica]